MGSFYTQNVALEWQIKEDIRNLGPGATEAAPKLGEFGAEIVYASDDETYADFIAQPHVQALAELAGDNPPDLILFATNYDSRDIAGRLRRRDEVLLGRAVRQSGDLVVRRWSGCQTHADQDQHADHEQHDGKVQEVKTPPATAKAKADEALSPLTLTSHEARVDAEVLVSGRIVGADDFVAVFSYGSMPVEKAEASMRLFAREVIPHFRSAVSTLAPA